ncbi:TerB family tellurite resistance protein [Sneathiella limimaris]|uniref:tellurite resistance TerB family protein n=1 Tax=Sneathiella limimaris TaxID=1964213 RepID=UPI00146CBCEF|nr:TerB family tellurite resistance protein [Sneathiella limimaris]
MLAKLKNIFSGKETADVRTQDPEEQHVATAALLIEAALSDETYCEEEKEMVQSLLQRHYKLSDEEISAVMTEAEAAHKNADQILYFTRTVKDTVEYDDRVHVIEMLWELAYADGEISDYEANLIRRVCGLIYVDDKESGRVRKAVQARLGQSS